MSRPFKMEGKNIAILQAIANAPAQYMSPRNLAEALAVKQPLIFKHLHTLEAYGYLTLIRKRGFMEITLTPKATAELSKGTGNRKPADKANEPLQKRAHALAHYYPLIDPIALADLRLCLSQSRIAYKDDALGQLHFTYKVSAELFSTYLMLYAPALYQEEQENSKELEAKVKEILDDVAVKLERQLNRFYKFKLMRSDRDTLISYYTKEEIAHEAHPIVQGLPKEESKRILAHSPIDGKERAGVDSSLLKQKGFKEFELYHKVTAGEDSNMVYRQFKDVKASEKDWNDLLDGDIKLGSLREIDPLKEDVKSISEAIHALVPVIQELEINIRTHNKVFKKLDERLDREEQERKQRRL